MIKRFLKNIILKEKANSEKFVSYLRKQGVQIGDNVPKEVGISEFSKFVPLKDDLWIKEILNAKNSKRENNIINNIVYDIKHTSNNLEEEYKRLYFGVKGN